MATKKQKEPDEIILPPPVINETPKPIMAKVRETREYVAPMEVKTPQPPREPEEDNRVIVMEEPEAPVYYQSEEDEDDYIDPIEQLLEQIGQAPSSYMMDVYRLPDYSRTKNASLKTARTIKCGRHPFDSDYEDLIQNLYAEHGKCNDFLVIVRRGSVIVKHLPVLTMEPPRIAKQPATQQSEGNHAIPAVVAPPADPLDALKKQAEVFRELKKIFNDDRPREVQAVATAAPSEMTPESAMLKLLEVEPAKLEAVRSKIFGNGEPSSGSEWVGLVKELLPFVLPLISGIAQRFAQPPMQQQAAHPGPQLPAQAMPEVPVQEGPPQEYLYLINRIIEGIARGVKPELVAEEIDAAMEKDEQLIPLIGGIVDAPIELIVSQLSMIAPQAKELIETPRAKMWLKELQGCFIEESDDANNGNAEQSNG